jgi:uncharacterized protein (DUF1697 family)
MTEFGIQDLKIPESLEHKKSDFAAIIAAMNLVLNNITEAKQSSVEVLDTPVQVDSVEITNPKPEIDLPVQNPL